LFTPRLREWRETSGETQGELGKRAGVALHTISRIEHGAPTTPRTARKIAEALGITVADLVEAPPVPLGNRPVPLDEASKMGQPIPPEPLRSRPGVWEWLLEQRHVPREDFPSLVQDLSNEDEVDAAIDELHETRDGLIEGLKDPSVQKALFGPARPGDFEGRKARMGEVFRPGKLASEVEWEIRSEYLARETALVNYGRKLFVIGEAEDYLVREPVGERDHERHERLLEARRVFEETYARQLAAV
jgi:transcriptional regulator with XRE-family HTH domain